jgi:hypothetical protein
MAEMLFKEVAAFKIWPAIQAVDKFIRCSRPVRYADSDCADRSVSTTRRRPGDRC